MKAVYFMFQVQRMIFICFVGAFEPLKTIHISIWVVIYVVFIIILVEVGFKFIYITPRYTLQVLHVKLNSLGGFANSRFAMRTNCKVLHVGPVK